MPSISLIRGAAALTSMVALIACSESPTADLPPEPTTIELSAPAVTFAALGDTATVSATVRDQHGQLMDDVLLTWATASQAIASVTDDGLVTATGNGSTTVTAVAGEADASLTVTVTQVPVRLRFAPDPVTLVDAEDTVTVGAIIVDANDNPMPPEPVTWSVDAPDLVEVSPDGLVTAVADGQAVITATAGGVSGELAAFVGDAVVVVGSVSPSPMVVGSEAVIRGLGFSPNPAENDVRLDGAPAQVTLASSVELRIVVPEADCRPPREGEITVEARDMSDTATAAVRPEFLEAFEVGEGVYATGGCLHLGAGSAEERYLVGILSASEVPSSLTPARLAARTGSSALAGPARATDESRAGSTVSGRGRFRAPVMPSVGATAPLTADRAGPALDLERLVSTRLDRSGEAEIRAAERAWLESLGGVGPALANARSAPLRAPPTLGDTLDITVPGGSCTDGTAVRAVVRHVGRSAAFLEDLDNPVRPAFSAAEYGDLDDHLTETTLAVLTDYFGDFADVDDNDRVLVLLTKEVNGRENLAGFVFSGDLGTSQQCANSNQAEIFYGFAPDTAGVHGDPRTRGDVLATYPSLIAHELTHILQFTAIFSRPGPIKSTWELEGGATLAEQLVGYRVQGDGPRLNLGWDEWNAGRAWYNDWVVDMALYFGFDPEEPTVPRSNAPERCSWVGLETDGNAGPCENRRAVYGVPSTLLRFVLDHYGPEYPGGDAALMKELTASPFSGIETLEQATGEEGVALLTRFGATLWADDRVGDWLLSWNTADIFGELRPEARLRPYVQTGAAPTLDVSVGAASNAYLLWTPPTAHDPTSVRIRTQVDDEPLPEHMVLWLLRIQ